MIISFAPKCLEGEERTGRVAYEIKHCNIDLNDEGEMIVTFGKKEFAVDLSRSVTVCDPED